MSTEDRKICYYSTILSIHFFSFGYCSNIKSFIFQHKITNPPAQHLYFAGGFDWNRYIARLSIQLTIRQSDRYVNIDLASEGSLKVIVTFLNGAFSKISVLKLLSQKVLALAYSISMLSCVPSRSVTHTVCPLSRTERISVFIYHPSVWIHPRRYEHPPQTVFITNTIFVYFKLFSHISQEKI